MLTGWLMTITAKSVNKEQRTSSSDVIIVAAVTRIVCNNGKNNKVLHLNLNCLYYS